MCSGISSLGSATSPSGNSGKSRTSATARAYRRSCTVPARHGTARPVRAARPAARRAAAAPDRRAHAARRARGELLVPAPPRGVRVDRRARARPPRGRPRLRRGLRQRGARPRRGVRRRRRRQPGRVRARATQVRRREGHVRARHDRDLERRRRLRRAPADDRARAGPRRGAGAAARPGRAARRRVRLDPERADARAQGRGALGQPVARARVPPGAVPRAVRAPLRAGRPARPVPRGQAAPAPARDRARRLGRGAQAAATDQAVLRPLHAGDLRARLPPAARGAGRRAGPAGRAAPMSRAPGALAIVLHTHMPYVEGFGTWPFGEEWLWEAIALCYLPLLDALDAQPGRVTLSVTPVLGDQLEAPGALERCAAFLREIRTESHRLDAAAALGPGLPARLARHAGWTSAATHAVLPLLATQGGVRLQLATGIAAHRARSGSWSGGLWLPECAHAPWLDGLLQEAGVRASCVDLTDVLGRGSAAQLRPLRSPAGPLLVPLDRALLELVWSDAGYPSRGSYRDTHRLTGHSHQAWAVDGAPYVPARAARQARADAEDFVARAADRVRAGGLSVVALDTELLGLHWHEGVMWLAEVLAAAGRAALRIAPLDVVLDEVEPAPAPDLPVTSWGRPRDLSTWSGPAAGGLAWRQRAAELRAVAAAPCVSDRALRELLALQSSDWAFLATRATAGAYPVERAAAHELAFEAAIERPGEYPAGLRNLAPYLARDALAA